MTERVSNPLPVVWTVGHSTRAAEDFVALLKAHTVARLVDVRTVPRSRHNPQFNRDILPASLAAAGIAYEHQPGLGGLRRPREDSANTGWRNAGFRGYADYMLTAKFQEHLAALLMRAQTWRLAIMCAEAVPWRCHRWLLSDALLVRGVRVEHILSATSYLPHKLTPWARVDGTRILYPAAGQEPDQLTLTEMGNEPEN